MVQELSSLLSTQKSNKKNDWEEPGDPQVYEGEKGSL